jgi:hypothetical protein
LALWALGWAGLTLAGCGRPTAGPAVSPPQHTQAPWFADITAQSGVAFVHQVAVSGHYLFSESIGSGAAVIDFDNDGLMDLYFIHNVSPTMPATNRLFRQEAPSHFQDVTAGSGLDVAGYGNGLAVGDLNNDGLPELLITEYDRLRLFLNLGGGKFRDVAAEAGLTNRQWCVAAACFDYDRDGKLDLVIANYLDFDPGQHCPDARGQPDFCGPHGFHSTLTRLFHNVTASDSNGAMGPLRFEEATVSAGLSRGPGKAMAIVCADFDGDAWPDLFITDDGLPNRLFMNQRDGTFREEAVSRGLAYTGTGAAAANMGIALGDVDGDGLFDLFVPHLAEESHTLWRQRARGVFQDSTAEAGLLSMPWHGTGFAAVFSDLDNDGTLDLVIVNGLVRRRPSLARAPAPPELPAFWTPYAEPPQLFAGEAGGRFHEISAAHPEFCGEAMVGRGLVCADLDNDGAVDLVTTGIGSRARIFRNVTPHGAPDHHWLGFRLVDPRWGGRDAYGAEVTVEARGRRWWRLVQPAFSYASSNDPRVHFGLGAVDSTEQILVRWPDGALENFPGGPVDRYVVIRRGDGRPASAAEGGKP